MNSSRRLFVSLLRHALVLGGALGAALPAARAQSAFVPNRGQWDAPARWQAVCGEQTAWFAADGWTLVHESRVARRGVALRFRFVDAAPVVLRGEGRRTEVRHWFTGDRAVTDVPAYDALHYAEIYPGTNVRVHATGGALEYDLCLAPGADPARIVLRCEGADALELADDGALLVHTALGVLRQPAPLTWAVLPDGGREELPCRYRLLDGERFGFDVPGADGSRPVIIDPVLEWASYLGGSSLEYVYAVAEDAAGLTVAGSTTVSNYPTTPGAYDTSWNGQQDAFVSRLAPDGTTLLFSSFLGGSKDEEARAVCLDATGGIVVAGWTASANFPTGSTSFDKSYNGGAGTLRSDAFVTRLAPGGSALVFSSYLGGSKDDFASSVGVDGAGRVHVAGKTSSPEFPTTLGAFDRTHNGGSIEVGDAFVACLQANGAGMSSSTFLGGAGDEFANALLVAEDGAVTLAGWTASAGFPTTAGAVDVQLSGTSDAFLAGLSADASALAFATLLGGGGDENALALARGADGALHVAGTTLSSDFPVTGAAGQPAFAGGTYFGDAFVATLEPGAVALRSATYLGGGADDLATGLAVDADGRLVVGGWTQSSDLPLTGDALDVALGGSTDAFLARVDPADGSLRHGSYLGGPSQDKAYAVALSADGRATLAGFTNSAGFPVTAGSYDTHFDGFEGLIGDGFLAQYELEVDSGTAAAGWLDAGYALAGSGGALPVLTGAGELLPLSDGSVDLAGAAPLALAVFFSSDQAGYAPVKGGTLVPFPILSIVVATTDVLGGVHIPYTWPASTPPDATLWVQAWIVDAGGPFGLSASNALSATPP